MGLALCPCCGSEMEWNRTYYSGLMPGEHVTFWWECECGAKSPARESDSDAYAVASQRYVEPNRKLTMEDLGDLLEPTPIYVLHRYGAWQLNGWHIWEPCLEDRDCEIYDVGNYGITWDAYLRRPTDEECADTKGAGRIAAIETDSGGLAPAT